MFRRLLVLLCVAMLGLTSFGYALAQDLPPGQGTTPTPDSPYMEPTGVDLETQLSDSIRTAFGFYSMVWEPWGLEQNPTVNLTPPGLVLINTGREYRANQECNKVTYDSNYNNAFYCRSTSVPGATSGGVIVIPMGTMLRMATEGDVLGSGQIDSSAALPGFWSVMAVLAHEYSHFVQQQIAFAGGFDAYTTSNQEAAADCLAGTSMILLEAMFSAMGTPITSEEIGDIVETMALMGSNEPGGTHPTEDERTLAFERGLYATVDPSLNGGPPLNRVNTSRQVCFSTYQR